MSNRITIIDYDKGRNDRNFFREQEGVWASYYINNMGASLPISSGAATWQTATPATVTANTWTRPSTTLGFIQPGCGMKLEITRLYVEVTGACQVGLSIVDNLASSPSFILDGTTSNVNFGATEFMVRNQPVSTGGVVEFNFDTPLVLRSGQRIDFWYNVTGTTGVNWQISYRALRLCDDDNFGAPFTMCVFGDSISGFTADTGAYPFCQREDGTITGSWPFIVKELLRLDGIDIRIINKGIAGTNSAQWDWNINQGHFRDIKADLWVVNMGMNDAANQTNISTVAGTDGIYKKAIKNATRSILRGNPGCSIIHNNITSTDTPIRLTTITTGKYNGYTQLDAYRADMREAVADINTANPNWDVQLAPTDTAYLSSQTTYFTSPQTPGNNLHPNTQLGQPAMAAIIYSKIKTSQFWLRNHK